LKKITTGILLQGRKENWTVPIIEEHQQNFPDSEIVVSTWDYEDVSDIPCKVIQTKLPEPTSPYQSTKNYQIIGCRNGLKEMTSDIILKTRTDIFVHNPNIFKIFLAENTNKIIFPDSGFAKESRDYWIADYVQLSTRENLLDYWNLMPLHDGTTNEAVEKYLTRNYVLKIKNDNRPWDIVRDEYYLEKRYHEDFQIEFEKSVYLEHYQDLLLSASMEDVSDDRLFKLLDASNMKTKLR